MIAFGGTIGDDKRATDTLDELVLVASHGANFTRQILNVTPGPSARYEHSAIYDPVNKAMLVYGGQMTRKAPVFSDLWALDLREPMAPQWMRVEPSAASERPSGLTNHSAVYDPLRQQMVLFGGKGASGREVWALELSDGLANTSWTKLLDANAGGAPGALSDHTAAWVGPHDYMVVYGGYSSGREVGTAWLYSPSDTAGHNWRPDPDPSICDATDTASACNARLSARVYRDLRCDGVYNAGFDALLPGATVRVTVPAQARVLTAIADASGVVYFSGIDVPAGEPVSIDVTAAGAGGMCGYRGGPLVVRGSRFGLDNMAALSIGLAPAGD
jgi:hypothetical protein